MLLSVRAEVGPVILSRPEVQSTYEISVVRTCDLPPLGVLLGPIPPIGCKAGYIFPPYWLVHYPKSSLLYPSQSLRIGTKVLESMCRHVVVVLVQIALWFVIGVELRPN